MAIEALRAPLFPSPLPPPATRTKRLETPELKSSQSLTQFTQPTCSLPQLPTPDSRRSQEPAKLFLTVSVSWSQPPLLFSIFFFNMREQSKEEQALATELASCMLSHYKV